MATSGAKRTVTLSDVARAAGVSLSTASKALNGRDEVSPATRQRVVEVAKEMAFTPSQVARSLLAGRTGTVGLLTSDLEGRFVIPILMGAEDAFGAGEVNVFLCDARGDAIREQYHLRALLNRRVDGIIVVGRQTDPRPSLGHDLPVPVVYAYAPSDDPTDSSLTPDNEAGGRAAVEHLISVGRSRIAHITGEPSYAAARDRVTGSLAALRAAGLEPVGDVMFSDWSERWGRDATAALLARHPDVDGIVCGSDQIARGALDTLRDLGRSVPEDVAIVGFDDFGLSRLTTPGITTVHVPAEEMARIATERLFDLIAGTSDGPSHQRLPVVLVERESCGTH